MTKVQNVLIVTIESIVHFVVCRKVETKNWYYNRVMDSNDMPQWLSYPEVSELLQIPLRDVRNLVRGNFLLAVRRGPNNALAVHRLQFTDKSGKWEILRPLRGTLTALRDAGFDSEEAMRWLLEENVVLGTTPLQALRENNIHAVRREITGLIF